MASSPPNASIASAMLAVGRHPAMAAVRRALTERCGISDGAAVVLGVSGGPDSLALLLACAAMARRTRRGGIRPRAVHVHHHLRPSADDDARFVQSRCLDLDVPCEVVDVAPARLAGNRSANARELRYAALARAAQRHGAEAVAVAHHVDDQLETILMALCRGAGLDGLAGMPWRRELAPGVALVRPMLGLRKADCESLCRAAGQPWRVDPTNADSDRVRARLRRDVTPVLEELWPGAAAHAGAAAEILAAARWAVETLAPAPRLSRGRAEFARSALRLVPPAVAAHALRRAALLLRPQVADDLSRLALGRAAELACGPARGAVRLRWPGGLSVTITRSLVTVEGPGNAGRG